LWLNDEIQSLIIDVAELSVCVFPGRKFTISWFADSLVTGTKAGNQMQGTSKLSAVLLKPITGLLIIALCLFVLPVHAQESPETDSTDETRVSWQPPEIAELPADWWTKFDTVSADVSNDRLNIFMQVLAERIQALDSENLVTARNSLANLQSLVNLLEVAGQSVSDDQFEPIAANEQYSIDEELTLRRQWRTLEKLRLQLSLEIEQINRQVALLIERRDRLSREYSSIDSKSPTRILSGLNRVIARVEFELSVKQLVSLQLRLKKIGQRTEQVRQQQQFAQEHLFASEDMLTEAQTQVVDAKQSIDENEEKIAALQNQLLSVLSGTDINNSLELLRKQQLTRASSLAALSRLEQALAQSKISWFRIRSGELKSGSEFNNGALQTRRLVDETKAQVELWTRASQGTLISSPPEENLNETKNFEIARSVARDTLGTIEDISNRSDDLLLMADLLALEIVSAQSGFGRAWAQLSLSLAAFRDRSNELLDFGLFDIGETAVTPGGIIKMLFIITLALGISWFIRQLLSRVTGRKLFRRSPAIYTLGRLLHYIIILVGSLIALGSIGIDFTNFALIAGALSVGIGFGLQAIVNNFVSGLILLFEGSLRVGDYIELDSGLAGVVKEINTRATIVNTNDSVDVVVPNSELVTTKLTNWTLRESVGRVRIPFGVAYGSDKEVVKQAALEAANEMEFILLHMPDREPQVRLVKFGDSSLEFELLAWLSRQGVRRPNRVASSFLWALDTRLKVHNIEVPFPQRDLHIRSDVRVIKKKTTRKKTAAKKAAD
jgi:potassium efflux system protein